LRAVFDTNVIVAGIVAEGLCREIIETHLPAHTPILSPPLWHELVEKLREKFELHLEELPVLHFYRRLAVWVEPAKLAERVCRDPDDDWVLATAAVGQAEVIVSGDQDLLVLGGFRGIPILTPRGFLERLPGAERPS
jgi:putative PIN family toxin of toxin-antitoxin system